MIILKNTWVQISSRYLSLSLIFNPLEQLTREGQLFSKNLIKFASKLSFDHPEYTIRFLNNLKINIISVNTLVVVVVNTLFKHNKRENVLQPNKNHTFG